VPFLGRPAPAADRAWVLAAALGCPVYWLSCLKADGRYTLQSELLFDRIEMPRAQRASVLARVMTVYAQRLEWPAVPLPTRGSISIRSGRTGGGSHLMLTASTEIVVPFHDLDRSISCGTAITSSTLKWRAMN